MRYDPGKQQSTAAVSTADGTTIVAHIPQGEAPSIPSIAAGYSDGTVRMFDLEKVEMVLKMHPHAVAVTAIKFSADGMITKTRKLLPHMQIEWFLQFKNNHSEQTSPYLEGDLKIDGYTFILKI